MAEVLARAKELVVEEEANSESVAGYLQRRRREVFVGGVGAVDPEFEVVAARQMRAALTQRRSRLSMRVRTSTPSTPPSGQLRRKWTVTLTARTRT